MSRHWVWALALAALALGVVWMGRESRGQAVKAPPPQWEYAVEGSLSPDDAPRRRDAILKAWNKLGAEGWEMCGADRGYVLFKRQKR